MPYVMARSLRPTIHPYSVSREIHRESGSSA